MRRTGYNEYMTTDPTNATNADDVPTGSMREPSDASERIDHDQLFKLLLTEFFTEFVALFFPVLAAQIEPDSLEFLDKELFTDIAAGSSHEADIIVKARVRGSEAFFIIHVEAQSTSDTNFGERMFLYFARLYEKYRLPIYPIVLFSYDTPHKAAAFRHTVRVADLLTLNFRYRVIQLNRLSWRKFMRQDNPIAGALMAKMRIAPKDRPKVKLACLTLLGGLPLNEAQQRLLSVFVDTYLRLTPGEEQAYRRELAKLGPQEEKQTMVLTTSWEQQGMQREAVNITSRQLARRFGPLTADMQVRLDVMAKEKLEMLALELLDFTNIGQVQAWLDAHA